MRRLFLILSLVVMVMMSTAAPAAAQDENTVRDRIDQAMAHLTQYLGLTTPISRQANDWRWVERIYVNSAFGCGVPNNFYPEMPNRAIDITIVYNDVNYDYRLSWDGVIMVLCGSDGTPLFRSDDGSFIGATANFVPPENSASDAADAPAETRSLDSSAFFAWVYMRQQQRFYLIDDSGQLASVDRPQVTNAPIDGLLEFAVSRNGRYLAQTVQLASGGQALDIYDFATGQQLTLASQPNETIFLGPAVDADNTGNSSLIFSPDSTQIAVGYAQATDPELNQWRVSLIDLTNGAIIAEVNQDTIFDVLAGGDVTLRSALGAEGSNRALPLFIDNDGGIHVLMIRQFSGGSESYPAFVWYPFEGRAEQSRYTRPAMDILPADSLAIYSQYDPSYESAPDDGMLPPANTIVLRDYRSALPTESYLLAGSDAQIVTPRWADGGDQVIYRAQDGDRVRYVVFDVLTGEQYILPGVGVGAPGGVLASVEGASGPEIAFYADGSSFSRVWEAPPQNGPPVFAWVQPEGTSFGLTQVNGQPITSSVPTGETTQTGSIIAECGELPSIVQVGITVRTTIDDGQPLNVRAAPSTVADIVRILPEGAQMTIVGGPQCAEFYTWWQVQLDDAVFGWVAEAGSEFYFIEPQP